MDDHKDISQKDTLVKLLDGTSIRTEPFGRNVFGERVFRRAERVAIALHLITNHISSGEPARHAVRELAVALLSEIVAMRDTFRNPDSQECIEAQGLVRRAISLVRLLAASGRISLQNAEALVAALDDLGVSLMTSQRTPLAESLAFTREDFAVEGGAPIAAVKDRRRPVRVRSSKGEARAATLSVGASAPSHARSEEIVGILGTQGQLGIKDIAASLPSYSEKMIQRELKRLVELGRVRKAGAKRWSTYALVKE